MITLDEVCRRAHGLPSSPALLPRLIELLDRHDAEIDELAQLIQLDPLLAAAILRMANSVFFGSSQRAGTVGEAVMRLGMRELFRLAALSLTSRWMDVSVDGYRWEPGDFCRASLVKAVAVETLALRTDKVNCDVAYTCGLVHEIGKQALAYTCGAVFPQIRAHCATTGSTWLEAEKAILGFNHAEVSAKLLNDWRFPKACIVVSAHNPPGETLPDEYRALAAHVHAAHHLAACFGSGQGEDEFLYMLQFEFLEEFGLGAAFIEEALPEIFDRASKLLREKLSTGRIVF